MANAHQYFNSPFANINAMVGSKADVPKELLAQIQYLEDLFTVDTKKLKEITDHFITELDKGK